MAIPVRLQLTMTKAEGLSFRHNDLRNAFFQTHDRARSGLVSANAWEVYNNTFGADTQKWKAIDLTAGTGVVWGNTFTGSWSVPIGAMDYKTFNSRGIPPCDGSDPSDQNVPGETGWRCQYQIGSQSSGATAVGYPAYIWGNTNNGSLPGMQCTAGCEHVKSGKGFYQQRINAETWLHSVHLSAPVAAKPEPPADTTAPSDPTNIATSTVSASQIKVSWSASTDNVGVTGYRLERCTGVELHQLLADRDPERHVLFQHRPLRRNHLPLPGACRRRGGKPVRVLQRCQRDDATINKQWPDAASRGEERHCRSIFGRRQHRHPSGRAFCR